MTCWAIIQQYKTKQPFIRRERRPRTKCLMSKLQMPDTIIWWIWNTTSIDLDRCCLCYYKILGIRRICASSRGYNTLLSSLYVIQLYEAFSDLVQRYTSHRTISVNCSYLCVKNTNNLDRGAKPNYHCFLFHFFLLLVNAVCQNDVFQNLSQQNEMKLSSNSFTLSSLVTYILFVKAVLSKKMCYVKNA